ncbi:YjgP/YjgQ family permease [Deinococcus metallilatus]|uniref:YjgP/YjgQ family permease n=1 Tax=Deinococcus metallilatus TaxID=1211322 RepID=A0AAJ5F4I3_9DEIO|nr:LptF/LptG family permease [Deinococcus metallilatus]QBY07526.1 YjgP/YjgQ family permease [Deinococcus metallilatus]RXJ13942.1 YjgP/YjgQ family permease [Deinococcus metallilatus]TLK29907.1 YjgP/YjgQ family permease [Deinococcus metallilatus]
MPPVPFTLNRYVLREVLRWYAAGLALFLILQLTDTLSTTVSYLLLYHATLPEALAAFGAIAPNVLNRSLVLAVPFAVLLAFGRLQGDSELKAMFAAGVRPLGLVWPLALPFLLVGAVAFVNAGYVVPGGQERWDRAWYTIYGQTPPPPSQENYTFAPPGALFYAGRVTNNAGGHVAQLEGVLVQRGQETVTANSGTWDTRAHTWTLPNAWITRPGEDPRQLKTPLVLSQADTLDPPQSPAEQVSTPELRTRLASERGTPQERRDDAFQLARRYADPVTPVVFALAAGMLGLLLRSRAAGFAATVVFLVMFYVLWISVPQLARVGALAPTLAAWLPSLAFLLLATVLAWRLR